MAMHAYTRFYFYSIFFFLTDGNGMTRCYCLTQYHHLFADIWRILILAIWMKAM